ncbi:MAG: penicillin acylase family protein [Candidatus Lokiarchaeota archaeon]|nr:penicillin acylase family protein [Candidatus Lokiarchaeota archaeon]
MEELLNIAKNAFPQVSGTETIKGIEDEVEILWDKWGVPHIYARSMEDAYFTQGYIHASHRLWQLETFRRFTSGTLSEIIGAAMVDQDKHYRIIGLHRIAKKCVANLRKDPNNETLRSLKSYVAGVNAGIEKASTNLPVEFAVLNIKPEKWSLEDSLKIMSYIEWGLGGWSYTLELLRENLITKLGVEMADKIIPLYSGANVDIGKGSNGWVVSPNKSESGAVLFANDPHLPLMLPAIWILMHLSCPELNTIGSSFPGVPSVVLGHNEKIAWGATTVTSDNVDLFKLELNPENENQYKYNGEWIDFEVMDEPIAIQNRDQPIDFKVKISKFGPVMEYIELQREVIKISLPDKYALHWTSYDVNLDDTIEGFRTINSASNWSEFRKALSKMTVTPQNFIYGDIEGNIGHQHGGKLPLRKYGDGATVTPGTDEKFNWSGLVPFEKMFSIFNPEHGFVYTANYNEDKAPNGVFIAQDRAKPYRQMRIKSLLQSKEVFTIQDFINYQLDLFTMEAEELLPKMLKYVKVKANTEVQKEIIELLENWDYFLTKNSVAGIVYKIWYQEILRAILIPLIGIELFEVYLTSNPFEIERLFKLFEEKDELEDTLFRAFENTIKFLTEKFSSDFTKWKWGDIHKVVLTHPFSQVNEEAKMLNIGPFKIGGDGNTLWNGSYDPTDEYKVIVGPSYRQIHDLSDWDKSIGVIPGGQAGLPFHKHYNDLMKLWVKGKYIPLLFTRKAISENLEGTFKLIPQ